MLVAVSGGADSMVLLNLLYVWQKRFKIELGVVHLHHGIRGRDAEADLELVTETAKRLDVRIFCLRESVPAFAAQHNLSPEAAGHQLRQKLFEELANKNDYNRIATGHHLDDQVETVLMRLIWGTGLKGLLGIRLKKGCWIRPLLFASRSEIENYACKNKIRYRTDQSNKDLTIPRNKIRWKLVPLLRQEFNPQIAEHISHFSEILREWDRYLGFELAKVLKSGLIKSVKNKITLEISPFELYFSWLKIQIVEHILSLLSDKRSYRLSYDKFDNFDNWVKRGEIGSEFQWDDRLKCILGRTRVVFFREEILKSIDRSFEIFPGHLIPVPGTNLNVKLMQAALPEIRFTDDKSEEFIDGSKLRFPLILKKWQSGDRFVPLGFNHSRLISDFLTDLKIARPEKDNIWILKNGDEIVAVLGFRIDHRYRIRKNSKNSYIIKLSNIQDGKRQNKN